MKILMIAPEPFLEPRGTPISVYQRLCGLSALGHTVDLLTYHVGQDVAIANVTIHRIPAPPFIQDVKVGPSWQKIVLDLLLLVVAVRMLLTNRYAVIHSHEEAALFASFLAVIFGVGHVYDMHSSLPQQLVNFDYAAYRPFIKTFEVLERWSLRNSAAVITIGSDLEAYAQTINPALVHATIENLPIQTNGHANGNGRDPHNLRDKLGLRDRLSIVYTGTFERYQGVDLLIESARLLRRQHVNVRFVLVGGKADQISHWRKVVQQYELEDSVLFVGTVPIDHVHSYLDVAEILVSPRIEGLSVPLKIYTYMQSGKPIVATDIDAHTLVLNSETAVLVRPTGEDFAAGLVQLIQNAELRAQIGHRARQLVDERYDLPSYLAKLDRVYRTFESADIANVIDHSKIGTFEH